MEKYLAQVLQKDVGRRLQLGQEIIDYISDKDKSHDLEQDQTALDRMVDGIASLWVNSSNFKVNCGRQANALFSFWVCFPLHAGCEGSLLVLTQLLSWLQPLFPHIFLLLWLKLNSQ